MSVKSIWNNVSFKPGVSLLIFCLDDLSICESGVLKSPTIIVAYYSLDAFSILLSALMLHAYIFTIVIYSSWIDPFIII